MKTMFGLLSAARAGAAMPRSMIAANAPISVTASIQSPFFNERPSLIPADAFIPDAQAGLYLGTTSRLSSVLPIRCQTPSAGEGRLYDCDSNRMLEIPLGGGAESTIWEIEDVGGLAGAWIATGAHCFGCTAGAGSSCGGAIA